MLEILDVYNSGTKKGKRETGFQKPENIGQVDARTRKEISLESISSIRF